MTAVAVMLLAQLAREHKDIATDFEWMKKLAEREDEPGAFGKVR